METVPPSPLAALEEASERDWETGAVLVKALDLWCDLHHVPAAALFAPEEAGGWDLVARSSSGAAAGELSPGAAERRTPGVSALRLPGNFLLCFSGGDGSSERPMVAGELGLLLAASARLHRVHERLKDQVFQENYKVVTLEALYDVGLSVASTLDLERLCDEILLRAVSLLDARRGALYLLDGDRYRLHRTIGGSARSEVLLSAGGLGDLSTRGAGGRYELLPESKHPLVVPIEVDRRSQGILAVADKESRTGVGPFPEADRRALGMFASQAAIALENAQLHRQALEKERLERELELAAEIQRGLLPARMPSIEGVEILGWSRPTRQVGGDYYGHLALQGERIGLVVADVTGKGMPAALLVSTLHSAIHLLLEHAAPDEHMLAKLNQHIAESSGANKFITMLLVEIDPRAGRLGYLNAGHNPGLLLREDGLVERLPASGLPLGLLRSATYSYRQVEHRAGDLLCLYSDGITECVSPAEEEFGEERLIDYLTRHREAPLADVLSGLERAVTEFAAGRPQADDQTVVLVRRS